MQNATLSERLAFLSSIKPQAFSTSTTTVTSAYVAQTDSQGNKFSRYLGVVQLNTAVTGTSNIVVTIVKASDTSGTGAAVVSTATFTGTAANDVIQPIDFNPVAMDTNKPYIALQVTQNGTGVANVSGLLLGGDGKYDPATVGNAADVAAIIGNI